MAQLKVFSVSHCPPPPSVTRWGSCKVLRWDTTRQMTQTSGRYSVLYLMTKREKRGLRVTGQLFFGTWLGSLVPVVEVVSSDAT